MNVYGYSTNKIKLDIYEERYAIRNDLFDSIKEGDVIEAIVYTCASQLKNTTKLKSKIVGKVTGKYKHFFMIQEFGKKEKLSFTVNDVIDQTLYIVSLTREGDEIIKNNIFRGGKTSGCVQPKSMEINRTKRGRPIFGRHTFYS